MHGRARLSAIGLFVSLIAISLTGCVGELPLENRNQEEKPAQSSLAIDYDPAETGTIHGTVRWQGKRPNIEEFTVNTSILFHPSWPANVLQKSFTNPNAPVINPSGGGVANAVVFLKKVDLKRAKPWEHGPVRAEFADYRIRITQGNRQFQTGFVQNGRSVKLVSAEDRFHIVQANGAAFFSLTLPAANDTRQRRLNETGIVELSSGAHYFWLRAYLFVDEHPYYARCDGEGRFRLDRVPAGEYEITAWMPNWLIERSNREPEHRHISRLYYRPPVEQNKRVRVKRGEESVVGFEFGEEMFLK